MRRGVNITESEDHNIKISICVEEKLG